MTTIKAQATSWVRFAADRYLFTLHLLCWSVMICVFPLAPYLEAQERSRLDHYEETIQTESGEISFEMIAIPGGEFVMGSGLDEAGREEDEGPRHSVRLSPFYLGSTEVTLELFLAFYRETVMEERDQMGGTVDAQQVDAITGPTPIYGDLTMGNDLDHPAIGMSWLNAVTFCKWLSKKTGKAYRLPTEAEWEYACRAGASHTFGGEGGAEQLERFAWYDDNSDGTTQAVGTREPNAWGLYDISGNVREWVHDFYGPDTYARAVSEDPLLDPQGPPAGKVHVARGGDYSSFPEELRCAARAFEVPEWRNLDPQIPKSRWWLPFMDIIGFRVARSAD